MLPLVVLFNYSHCILFVGEIQLIKSSNKTEEKAGRQCLSVLGRLPYMIGFLTFCFVIAQSATHEVGGNPPSHKIHVSVAQLDYNRKSQTVEIALRVFADDLENALSQHAKRQVKLDPATANKDKRIGGIVMAYLRDYFQLKSKEGKPIRLNWVRMEWQADMFWLYVRGRLPSGLQGAQLRNKVFTELFDDQVNIVNSRIEGKQIGLIFDPKDGFKPITAAPPVGAAVGRGR